MTDPILTCPECDSDRVTTEHHQMFMVNTSEHYCHSVKTHDADSPATCLACWWKGSKVMTEPTDDASIWKLVRKCLPMK